MNIVFQDYPRNGGLQITKRLASFSLTLKSAIRRSTASFFHSSISNRFLAAPRQEGLIFLRYSANSIGSQ